jgi:hypothetical protein
MKVPHRGARRARSRAGSRGMTMAGKEKIAPRKRAGGKFPRRTGESAAEVIVRVEVLSRKTRTAVAQDSSDLWSGRSTPGATPWRSTYRRCSSRAGGSVPESASGAANWHRRRPHRRLLWNRPTGPCQRHRGAREPPEKRVAPAPGWSDCPDGARPPPTTPPIGKPSRRERRAPSPRASNCPGCVASVSDW